MSRGDKRDESKFKPEGTFYSEPRSAPHLTWAKDAGGEVRRLAQRAKDAAQARADIVTVRIAFAVHVFVLLRRGN
jgi:hypothetical protein